MARPAAGTLTTFERDRSLPERLNAAPAHRAAPTEHCHLLLTGQGRHPSAWQCSGHRMPSLGAGIAPLLVPPLDGLASPGSGGDPVVGAACGAPQRALPLSPRIWTSPLGVAMQRASEARFRGRECPFLTAAAAPVRRHRRGGQDQREAASAALPRALPHPPPTRTSPLGVAMQRAADARSWGTERPTITPAAGITAGRCQHPGAALGAPSRPLPLPPDRTGKSPLGVALRPAVKAGSRGTECPRPIPARAGAVPLRSPPVPPPFRRGLRRASTGTATSS